MVQTRRSGVAASASQGAVNVGAAELNGASPSGAAAPSAADKENFKGEMLKASPININAVRFAVVAASVALAAGSVNGLSKGAVAFLHLITFAIWFGTNFWNTFFVGLTMFANMPRQTFGRVQSKLFPLYFSLTTGCNLLLLGHVVLKSGTAASQPLVALALAAVASAVNWLWLEPLCTSLMFARYDIENKDVKSEEDQAEIKRLYKQFGKWHGISSLNNLVVFACAAVYCWSLANGGLALL